MKYFSAIIVIAVLMTGCSNSSKDTTDESQSPTITTSGGVNYIESENGGISALPRLEFSGLEFFNSSKDKGQRIERPESVVNVLALLMEGDKIKLATEEGEMVYKISFPNSYESVNEETYGWCFKVSRTDTSYVNLTEVRLYEEDKDGLPYFAFVDANSQWSTWDIIKWDGMPKRKILARYPAAEDVDKCLGKKLGEDFVGL